MRTLHLGLRVADLERSLTFYRALGYSVVGSVPATALGQLTMLKLPGDDFVTLELVSGPSESTAAPGDTNTLSHFVIKVESLDATLAKPGASIDDAKEETTSHERPDGLRTGWITDPDGNRIELVQWPPGHTDGMTAAEWPHAERSDHGGDAEAMSAHRRQTLRLLEGRFTLEQATEAPEVPSGTDVLALVFGPDGRTEVRRDDTAEDAWAALWNGDEAHDPQATGMLSAIVAPLAAGELPVWVASSFDGDLVLVPADRLDEAVDVLRHAGHLVPGAVP